MKMLVRSAFWIGQPKPGNEAEFKQLLDDELIPAMRLFPGVRAVHALWPIRLEDAPPAIHCQVLVEFASADDLGRMMESDERFALRPRVKAAVGLFDGSVSHIEYEAA